MIQILQTTVNEGPTPGNTQLPNGLVTIPQKPMTTDPNIALTTCATFGGPHTDRTFTSKLGTQFVNIADMIGGQGNINTDQELVLWYAQTSIAGVDEFTQKFLSGDNDYQAEWNGQVKGLGALLMPAQKWAQNNIPPDPGILQPPQPFEITQAMCPCVIYIAVTCISELGEHYTPSTGQNVHHWGSWWRFGGEGDNSPNLTVGLMYVNEPGSYLPTMNAQSTVAEYYQGVAAVFADVSGQSGTTTGTNETITLSPEQTANLANGGTLTIVGSV